ncbi:MAG: hypothetical protein V1792_01215 [Pseudomonadota bacterium]
MDLVKAVWGFIIAVGGEYLGILLVGLFMLGVMASFYYTGEVLLRCFVRGYRIRRGFMSPEPLPDHEWLSNNSIFIGFFFWVIVGVLLHWLHASLVK